MTDQDKPESPKGDDEPKESRPFVEAGKPSRRHPAFGLMKDLTIIAPSVDLTEPACPEWAELIDEKYGRNA